MESLMQIRHSLWEIMKKLILSYVKKRKPLQLKNLLYNDNFTTSFSFVIPYWIVLYKILEHTEARISAEESKSLVSGGFVPKWFEGWAESMLSLTKTILQEGDVIENIIVNLVNNSTMSSQTDRLWEMNLITLRNNTYKTDHYYSYAMYSRIENKNYEPHAVRIEKIDYQPQNMCWTLFRNKALKDEGIECDNCILLEIAMELYNQYRHDPSLLENIATLFWSDLSVKDWEFYRDIILKMVKDASKSSKLFSLKLSKYDQLQPDIQMCVRYCLLFPKGHTFIKTDLINLWASQEYSLTTHTAANPESIGDKYFGKLLEDGYFFERNGTGDVFGYKMHYVVNEFLKEIAKPEFCLVDECHEEINFANILHLSFIVDSSWKAPSWLLTASNKLQSLLFLPGKLYEHSAQVSEINEIITRLMCVRALDLTAVNCNNLPSSLGELKDLRYLKLGVSLKNLPECITRLENLQTLDLRYTRVKSSDFETLRHLRHLYLGSRLVDNPSKLWELESLQTLEVCVVSQTNYWLDARGWFNDPTGKLTIRFEKQYEHGEILKDRSSDGKGETSTSVGDSHHNLKSLIPENLVSICIADCNNCKTLPQLGSLPYLRSLQLWDLKALEYVDNNQPSDSYFPSLKYLMLANLRELKGWSSRLNKVYNIHSNSVQLKIKGCPKLKSIPSIPNLVSLEAHDFNSMSLLKASPSLKALQSMEIVSSSSDFEFEFELSGFGLNDSLEFLTVRQCHKLKNMDFLDITKSHSYYSIQQLAIHECSGLQEISIALRKLPYLQKLVIARCENLNLGDNINSSIKHGCLKKLLSLKLVGISNLASLENGLIALESLEELSLHSFYELKALPEWIGKLTKLQRLAIRNCPYLITLPHSLGGLSTLQHLEIQCCPILKQIPTSFAHLKSLQQLKIQQCPKLFTRCQMSGEDFPLIQHITPFILLE